MKQRGFTIVELIITITIMAILLTLSAVGMRSYLANGRDEERRQDAASLARGLERRYQEGNPVVKAPSYVSKGSYPGVNEVKHIFGDSVSSFTPAQITNGYRIEALPGTTIQNFTTPGGGTFALSCETSCAAVDEQVTKNVMLNASNPESKMYLYQPVTRTNQVCTTGDCVKFNLYYRTEVDGVVNIIQSKNQ